MRVPAFSCEPQRLQRLLDRLSTQPDISRAEAAGPLLSAHHDRYVAHQSVWDALQEGSDVPPRRRDVRLLRLSWLLQLGTEGTEVNERYSDVLFRRQDLPEAWTAPVPAETLTAVAQRFGKVEVQSRGAVQVPALPLCLRSLDGSVVSRGLLLWSLEGSLAGAWCGWRGGPPGTGDGSRRVDGPTS